MNTMINQPLYHTVYLPQFQTSDIDKLLQQLQKLREITAKCQDLTDDYSKPITQTIDNTKTYTEVEDSSLYSFKSRHLISSSRPRIAAHARQVIRGKSRGIEEFETKEDGKKMPFSRAIRKCMLYNGLGLEAKSRFREIWEKGYFTLRNGNTAHQNSIVLDNDPLLLADIRKEGDILVIEYSHGRRNKTIDDIALKNHYNKYYHLDRRGC